ncbi:MAG: TolC family protein [Halarcobacter sp.]
MKKKILRKIAIVLPIALLGTNLYSLDIDEAVESALLNNNSFKKQQYIYDEAKENINISKGAYQPKLDLSYSYNAKSENLDNLGKDHSNGSATLSYNLFNGLTDKYNLKSSEELALYSMFSLEAAKYDLILNTKKSYISYLKSLKNIETAENAFKLLEQQFRDSENKFEQGLLAKNDLLQVNAQMLQSKQSLARAKADARIARYQLKNILGGFLKKDEKIVALSKAEIMENTYNEKELEARSEIKALMKRIESIRSLKSANKGEFMPNADLSLAYNKYGDDAFLKTNEREVDSQETAMITLSWNLFNGGIDKSQDVIYQKRILQANEDLADLKLSIKLQYENALEEFEVSKLNFQTAKISLAQSKENYKIVNNRFKEGLSTSTDLINANYLLTSAKQSFDDAYYDRFLSKATLDRIFEK